MRVHLRRTNLFPCRKRKRLVPWIVPYFPNRDLRIGMNVLVAFREDENVVGRVIQLIAGKRGQKKKRA